MSTFTDEQLDEIDRLVAEKVMGWREESVHMVVPDAKVVRCWLPKRGSGQYTVDEWHPTRDRGQAMMVFEHLGRTEHAVRLDAFPDESGYGMRIWHKGDWRNKTDILYQDTPMLAICLGSLKRAGVEVPE